MDVMAIPYKEPRRAPTRSHHEAMPSVHCFQVTQAAIGGREKRIAHLPEARYFASRRRNERSRSYNAKQQTRGRTGAVSRPRDRNVPLLAAALRPRDHNYTLFLGVFRVS